jgi:hypothetical protein
VLRLVIGITEDTYYSMQFIEDKDGRTYVLFYDTEGDLAAKREILQQDIAEPIRLNGENN